MGGLVAADIGLLDRPGDDPTPTEPGATTGVDSNRPPKLASTLTPNAVVLRVIDGDTIEVDVGGTTTSVRLIGIDTPEKTGGLREPECYGDEATRRMQQLLAPGDPVHLERDVELYDRYDRLLAYVHRQRDGLFVNHALVLEGFAAPLRFEPNTFHAELFDTAAETARTAGLGLWGACGGPDRPLAP